MTDQARHMSTKAGKCPHSYSHVHSDRQLHRRWLADENGLSAPEQTQAAILLECSAATWSQLCDMRNGLLPATGFYLVAVKTH